MVLPNADRAEVDIRKLRDYCLSPVHPVGKHKAAVFRAALGLTVVDADWFRGLLVRAARSEEAITEIADEFGMRFRIDFELATPAGAAMIRSAWIIRADEDFPRLTTCFILPETQRHVGTD